MYFIIFGTKFGKSQAYAHILQLKLILTDGFTPNMQPLDSLIDVFRQSKTVWNWNSGLILHPFTLLSLRISIYFSHRKTSKFSHLFKKYYIHLSYLLQCLNHQKYYYKII